MNYQDFLEKKTQLERGKGFNPTFMPGFLFDFQKYLIDWNLGTSRSATFADCGMGKTAMQLVWAQNVLEHTNKPVLILAPLSVSGQTVEEAEKFDIQAMRSRDGKFNKGIVVTNYEKLHYFNYDDFSGVVCDESSILKNFDGAKKEQITSFMRKVPYRLLCTATAAPNDYIELGTTSEALGYLGYMDMLTMFFKNDEDTINPINIGSKWRFKKHAENEFWRWVASWARACRRPSDMGFSDDNFKLPQLNEIEHIIESPVLPGEMFHKPAVSLLEQREENRITVEARCLKAAEHLQYSSSGIAWCHLNSESQTMVDYLDGEQVSGSDADEDKEEKFDAFRSGQIKHLITKPKISSFGMNWQHCNHMTYFPSHSYEQYYQSIRRCWRFGQKSPVRVDLITTAAQHNVLRNMKAKAAACDVMFEQLVAHMNNAIGVEKKIGLNTKQELPSWI